MKKNSKVMIGVVAAFVAVVGGAMLLSNGGLLQGFTRISPSYTLPSNDLTYTKEATFLPSCEPETTILYDSFGTGKYATFDLFKNYLISLKNAGVSCPLDIHVGGFIADISEPSKAYKCSTSKVLQLFSAAVDCRDSDNSVGVQVIKEGYGRAAYYWNQDLNHEGDYAMVIVKAAKTLTR